MLWHVACETPGIERPILDSRTIFSQPATRFFKGNYNLAGC
jgi:hypothetical protein